MFAVDHYFPISGGGCKSGGYGIVVGRISRDLGGAVPLRTRSRAAVQMGDGLRMRATLYRARGRVSSRLPPGSAWILFNDHTSLSRSPPGIRYLWRTLLPGGRPAGRRQPERTQRGQHSACQAGQALGGHWPPVLWGYWQSSQRPSPSLARPLSGLHTEPGISSPLLARDLGH